MCNISRLRDLEMLEELSDLNLVHHFRRELHGIQANQQVDLTICALNTLRRYGIITVKKGQWGRLGNRRTLTEKGRGLLARVNHESI